MTDPGDRQSNPVDEYSAFMERILEHDYSADQRTLFTVALAEHWLNTHETAHQTRPLAALTVLRETLDAIWNHVQGKRLSRARVEELQEKVLFSRPAAEPGLPTNNQVVFELTLLSLQCSAVEANTGSARQASILACEAVMEPIQGYPSDPANRMLMWYQPAVRAEVSRQQTILMYASNSMINELIVDFIRQESRRGSGQLDRGHVTTALRMSEAKGLPKHLFTASKEKAAPLPPPFTATIDAVLRSSSKGPIPEDLRKLSAASEEMSQDKM